MVIIDKFISFKIGIISLSFLNIIKKTFQRCVKKQVIIIYFNVITFNKVSSRFFKITIKCIPFSSN